MKRCPSCQSTYTDDSLSFCLTDGAALVDTAFNPQAMPPDEFQGTSLDERRTVLSGDNQPTLPYSFASRTLSSGVRGAGRLSVRRRLR